jgi:hypothetical protein
MLVAHWLACIWYSIGRSDADNGVQYSWLWKLANVTQSPYSYIWSNDTNSPELINGPSRKTMYVTALYFTMTCMTSVGFGNVAAETDNEKIFTICMMIIAGKVLQMSFCTVCDHSSVTYYFSMMSLPLEKRCRGRNDVIQHHMTSVLTHSEIDYNIFSNICSNFHSSAILTNNK